MEKNAVNEILLNHSLKQQPKELLSECLNCYKVSDLKIISSYHNLKIKSNSKKAEIIELLKPCIQDNFNTYISSSKESLICISKLVLCNSLTKDELLSLDFDYSDLIKSGYVYLFEDDNNYFLTIPNEILESYDNLVKKEIESNPIFINENISNTIITFLNLYGYFEIEHLYNTLKNTFNATISDFEIEITIDKLKTNSLFWVKDNLIISPIISTNLLESIIKKRSNVNYYIPTIEEIDFYSNNSFDQNTIYFRNLKDFILLNNLVESEKFEETFSLIFTYLMFDFKPSTIIQNLNFELKSKILFDRLEQLLGDFDSNIRKWSLKGNYKRTIKTSKGKPFISELKIGRNNPCFCGSGIKYKKCCAHFN